MSVSLPEVLQFVPVIEQICSSLTFLELVQLRIHSSLKNFPCKVPVLTLDGQEVVLNGVDEETIAAYPYVRKTTQEKELTGFLEAIRDRNMLAIRGFLKSGFDPNTYYPDPFFHKNGMGVAAETGDIPLITFLASQGGLYEDPDQDEGGNSPIFNAVLKVQVEMVQFLLEQGTNPNSYDTVGNFSLLDWAVDLNKFSHSDITYSDFEEKYMAQFISRKIYDIRRIALILLEAGADPNYKFIDQVESIEYHTNSLHYAIFQFIESLEIVRLLLSYKADPNYAKEGFKYPLESAIDLGQIGIAELLLDAGADPNLFVEDIPLITALATGPQLVPLLLKHGADPNVLDPDGNSPLFRTLEYISRKPDNKSYRLYLESIQALLVAGANPNGPFQNGTIFSGIINLNYPHLTRLALSKGANPNSIINGIPIISNPRAINPDLVLDLLEAGANPNAISIDNLPIIYKWIDADNLRVVREILKRGGSPDGLINGEIPPNPPIFTAILKNSLDLVSTLVEAGANLSVVNKKGLTIRKYLQKKFHPTIAAYLKDKLPRDYPY